MRIRFLSRWSARATVRALERGKYHKLLDPDMLDDWMKFVVRQASIPHNELIVLRLTIHNPDPWYMWVVYKIVSNNPPAMKIDSIFGPASEAVKLETPEELAGLDYFPA